jgi:hypothetical protein
MLQTKTKTFYDDELRPVLKELKGPVESFVVRDEQEILDDAIETGEITPGAFSDCAVFDDDTAGMEQKKLRYEAKRAIEILHILGEIESDPSLEDRFAELYAQQTMARAALVEAARKLNIEQDGIVPRHEELYSRALDAAQEELFPSPKYDIAAYAATSVLKAARDGNSKQAEQLLEEYPFMAIEADTAAVALSPEKRQDWSDTLHELYDEAFAYVRAEIGKDVLSNETLPRAVRLFMERMNFQMKTEDTEGWDVVEDNKVAGFRVDPGVLRIVCGRRKKEITWPVFEKLMVHEVGDHATRAENGRKTGYDAMQNGLPGAQEFEEGLGLLMENIWTGDEIDTVGRDHFRYLTVCYADGFLDGNKHSEEESLRFVSRLMAARKPGGLGDEPVLAASRKDGVDHVKRAYRGMPKGKIMHSNLAYLAGKIEAVTFIESSDLPARQLLPYLQQGKTNPTDPAHVSLVHEIGE